MTFILQKKLLKTLYWGKNLINIRKCNQVNLLLLKAHRERWPDFLKDWWVTDSRGWPIKEFGRFIGFHLSCGDIQYIIILHGNLHTQIQGKVIVSVRWFIFNWKLTLCRQALFVNWCMHDKVIGYNIELLMDQAEDNCCSSNKVFLLQNQCYDNGL